MNRFAKVSQGEWNGADKDFTNWANRSKDNVENWIDCRVSSVGRARDWKSLCPWFDSETRHHSKSKKTRHLVLVFFYVKNQLLCCIVSPHLIFCTVEVIFGKSGMVFGFQQSEVLKKSHFKRTEKSVKGEIWRPFNTQKCPVFWRFCPLFAWNDIFEIDSVFFYKNFHPFCEKVPPILIFLKKGRKFKCHSRK